MSLKKQGKYRFTDFEIDLAQRTLLRAGNPITISPRTFDVLAFFVLNPQRLVTREDLLHALFHHAKAEESNLGQHLFLLRKALNSIDPGDRVLLTVAGGYRFTPQVTEIPRLDPSPEIRSEDSSPTTLDESADESDKRLPRFSPLLIAGLVVAVALLSIGGWYGWQTFHRPLGQTDQGSLRLVLADFENSTTNHQFDQALKTALTLNLQQSPYLSVAPEARVADAVDALKIPAGSRISTYAARQICQRLNGQVCLTASIRPLTQKFMVTVLAIDTANGKDRAQSRGIADSPDAVVAVLDKVALDLRRQLGESSTFVAAFQKPLFAGRPASLDALRAYSEAAQLQQQGKLTDAEQRYHRAIFLDPKFALAYADLSAVEASLGLDEPSRAALAHAYELRDSLDEQHRLILTAAYLDRITGDIQASQRNYEQWAKFFPHNPVPLTSLADLLIQIGKPAQALDPATRALALNPDNPAAYNILARAQMHLGQFEEATKTCQESIHRQIDGLEIHQFLLQIAFLRLDQPAIDDQLEWGRNSSDPPQMQLQQGLIAFAEGRARAALAIFTAAADSYRKQGQREKANSILAQVPRIQAELGLVEGAHAQLTRLGDMPDTTDIPVAWAHVGETTRAESLLKQALEDHPNSTLWQQLRAPQIRAAIALNQHQPADAVTALESASPYDLSSFDSAALRGRAYLAAHKPELAEAEFHKILDHPGIAPLSHDYPLAQLGLARALAAEEKTTEAGFAYKIVLAIWKDADPDLPRLKEARSEYARLNSVSPKSATKSRPR